MSDREHSPNTPAWRRVHAAYADPAAPLAGTWSLILAATPEYPERLADPAVLRTLAILLEAPCDPRDPFDEGARDALLALREQATKAILQERILSFSWYLAEIALHRAVLRGALRETTAAARARLFLREIVRAAADYLVARDLTDLFPRRAALLPGVAVASQRHAALVATAGVNLEQISFGPEPLADWPAAVRTAWSSR